MHSNKDWGGEGSTTLKRNFIAIVLLFWGKNPYTLTDKFKKIAENRDIECVLN